MDISIPNQIKLKFRDGAVCPHCGSKAVNKHGYFKNKQRYKCKECGKTFNIYTKTILSWCHHKDKWESFIRTMGQDLSLRCAEKQVGVSYVTLFYWRHKVMTILNQGSYEKFHGTLELMDMPLNYVDKYRNCEEEDYESQGRNEKVYLTFLYQRDYKLEAYLYKDRSSVRQFIYDLSEFIDESSMVCLRSGIPFRHPLLYKKIKVADRRNYKRPGYFNTDAVRKYLSDFKNWLKMFRGVSTKNLKKYVAFYRAHKIFNNMEGIIASSLREWGTLTNSHAVSGEMWF